MTGPPSLSARFETEWNQRRASVGLHPVGTADHVDALLSIGEVDEAAREALTLQDPARERRIARIALQRHDFGTARPLFEKFERESTPGSAGDTEGDALLFEWLFARDHSMEVDLRTRDALGTVDASAARLLAAGRLALEQMKFDRADSCYVRIVDGALQDAPRVSDLAAALRGRAIVASRRQQFDAAHEHLLAAMAVTIDADLLESLALTLIRLGRTDDAITCAEWAVRFDPYHGDAHYLLGNGYARKNYSELFAAYPDLFPLAAPGTPAHALCASADSALAAGGRVLARERYESALRLAPKAADLRVRLASLDFEDARFRAAIDLCREALALCPEYGRAHAVMAKALEGLRFEIDVRRPEYEARFAAQAMPAVPGIESFILNWSALSPRHQKRVAVSVEPWQQFIPVLLEGRSTYYIKPLSMLLSETPNQETLRDQRISYDSRLWDDVRGCGGYNTVTGLEDVERNVFDKYNTVLHELTHQVHSVLTADQSREIEELYRRAKERDALTQRGFLSRYAGGSVWEYFAEGANAYESPRRDLYDPREIVRERLFEMDPELATMVQRLFEQEEVGPSYAVALVNAGDDRIWRGDVEGGVSRLEQALARAPKEETALRSLVFAYTVAGEHEKSLAATERALEYHPTSGNVATSAADSYWHAGRGIRAARGFLEERRNVIRLEDRPNVDLARGRFAWIEGDWAAALAAYDSARAVQADLPEARWGRASAFALAERWDEAFDEYQAAIKERTGLAGLRADYARDLLRAGRLEEARAQLDEARILEPENPIAESLRGWLAWKEGNPDAASLHLEQALQWAPWCDLASILLAGVRAEIEPNGAAREELRMLAARAEAAEPPRYVYRESDSSWQSVHQFPWLERQLLREMQIRDGAPR